jgi:hypothetical protein
MGNIHMGQEVVIAEKERERAALLRLAGEIVDTGDRRGRPLSRGEDAVVVELVKKAQLLEHEINRLQLDRRWVNPSEHIKPEEV